MAKIFDLGAAATTALLKRKKALRAELAVPGNSVRASYVKQSLTCGKRNCRCRRGLKHGPFHYLVQCVQTGKMRKFLLKSPEQKRQAHAAIAAYAELQEKVEELSQINTELIRRGEDLDE